ncbi:MAG: diguanylate cyclase [Sulfurospirillaceae bacterium]|nr:diguanylate cyclase [Sulfurospirillaceae bacterium]
MKNTTYNMEDLDAFIELIQDPAFCKNTTGVYTHCNNALLTFFKKNREDVIGKTNFDLFPKELAIKFSEDDQKILENDTDGSVDVVIKTDNTKNLYFHTNKHIIYDENKNQLGLFCVAKDTTKEKQYEIIYNDNQVIADYIAIHGNLKDNLYKIICLAEDRNENSICSILLLDEEKKHLLNGSAPNLPDFYNKAVHGLEIGEKVGSCGAAAFKKKRVIVEDIDTHENWVPYLELAQKANLRSCWSEPVFSSRGEILGTFAIYHRYPVTPTDFELKLISSYAHLASVAIEKSYNEKIIKEKERVILEQTKTSNKKLKAREYELSQLFDNALVGLMYITGERKLIKGNQHLADIFGYDSPKDMIGISMRQLHLTQKRFENFGQKIFESLREREVFNLEYKLRKKDGTPTWCELSGKALDENIPADLSKGVLWTVEEINKRKELEAKVKERTREIKEKNFLLNELVTKDYLTGLYNRSKIDEVLKIELKHSERYSTVFGVIMMDIDFFKSVNDKHGHQVGDKILCEFANILKNNSRDTDVIGRWGGEEFLMIVKNITKENLLNLTEKLRKTIESYVFPVIIHKTASFGMTIFRSDDKAHEMVARADEALYQAKSSGRNCIRIL